MAEWKSNTVIQHIMSAYTKYISQLVKLKSHILLPKQKLGWTVFTGTPWTRLCNSSAVFMTKLPHTSG